MHGNTIGPGHSKSKIGVFLLREVLFAHVVHSEGVSEYGHHTAQESLLGTVATNKGRYRGLLTSMFVW